MSFKTAIVAAAAAIVLVGSSASASTTYTATSHYENDSPEHSVWFQSGPDGASGSKSNHFLFENTVGDEQAFGTFEVDGNTATLSGTVRNAALQGFELLVSLIQVPDPGVYKVTPGADPSSWTFYDFVSATLISKTDGLASFFLEMRGDGLKAQFGVGANDKDPFLLGFSTWFTAYEMDCKGDGCQRYHGDINIVLDRNPPGGVVPLPASLVLLPAALGMLGAAGRVARRRRKS